MEKRILEKILFSLILISEVEIIQKKNWKNVMEEPKKACPEYCLIPNYKSHKITMWEDEV